MCRFESSSPLFQKELSPVVVNHAQTIDISCAAQPLGFAIITLDRRDSAHVLVPEHEDHTLQYQ